MLWILALFLALIGGLLIRRGLRGKPVRTHPRCARCDYAVVDFERVSEPRCPECGADLSPEGAVSYGRHRTSPALLKTGVAVWAIAAACVAGAVWMQASGFDWVRLRPTSWLIDDFADGTADTEALSELLRRISNDRLAPGHIDRLAEAMVGHARSRSSGRERDVVGFAFQMLYERGDLSPEALAAVGAAAYERGPHLPYTPSRRRVRQGETISLEVGFHLLMRSPPLLPLEPILALRQVVLDEGAGELAFENTRTGGTDVSARGTFSPWVTIHVDAEPGLHTLTLQVDLGLIDTMAELLSGPDPPGPPELWPPTVHRWTNAIVLDIEVLPAEDE